MSSGFAVILGLQCLLFAVVGYFLYRGYPAIIGKRASQRRPGRAPSRATASVEDLLSEIGRVLAEHGDKIEDFEQVLAGPASESGPAASLLDDQIQQMRSANRLVEQTIESTLAGLISACGDLLRAERAHLEKYQGTTSKFDLTLQNTNSDELLAGVTTKLLDLVQDLRTENKVLQKEVTDAKDKTLEIMARANEAEQSARIDALTKLPNRRKFDEAHEECRRVMQQDGQPYSLILIDIDHFKSVNDRFGHVAGDAVLSMIGRLLMDSRRTSDQVCRLGGEEFGVLLPCCTADVAERLAEKYRTRIEAASLRYCDNRLSVTVSCGVAQAAADETTRRLLERADSALYGAKMAGRNQTSVAETIERVAEAIDPPAAEPELAAAHEA